MAFRTPNDYASYSKNTSLQIALYKSQYLHIRSWIFYLLLGTCPANIHLSTGYKLVSRRFLLQPVICAQSVVDLEIWADFGRFEWFCKRNGNSMAEIRVCIFGNGFLQATASLATCYNAVEGSYPPKSNNKVRKLDWHSIDVRRPSIGVQPSNNVRTYVERGSALT